MVKGTGIKVESKKKEKKVTVHAMGCILLCRRVYYADIGSVVSFLTHFFIVSFPPPFRAKY